MNHNLDTLLYGLYISPHTAFCEWGKKAVYKDTASHCHEQPCCAASLRTVNTKHDTCLFVFLSLDNIFISVVHVPRALLLLHLGFDSSTYMLLSVICKHIQIQKVL